MSVAEIKELLAAVAKSQAETVRQIKETNCKLESLGFVQDEVAEDLIRRNAATLLGGKGIVIDEVYYRAKGKLGGEYDILAVNGSKVVVIEVKTRCASMTSMIF